MKINNQNIDTSVAIIVLTVLLGILIIGSIVLFSQKDKPPKVQPNLQSKTKIPLFKSKNDNAWKEAFLDESFFKLKNGKEKQKLGSQQKTVNAKSPQKKHAASSDMELKENSHTSEETPGDYQIADVSNVYYSEDPIITEIAIEGDKNGDGMLSQEEWLGSPFVFAPLDLNKDGFLSIKELERLTPKERTINETFEFMDTNEDGYIEIDEYFDPPEYFAKLDLDGDNYISLEEFIDPESWKRLNSEEP